MRRRGILIIVILGVFFLAPVIPTSGNRFQLAGFFPVYASASCVLIHIGMAYGPNSFLGMRWVLDPFCGLYS